MGDFFDIGFVEELCPLRELQEFSLLRIEQKEAFYEGLGDLSIVRIHGVVASDKKALKSYVKEYAAFVANDPESKASKDGLVILSQGYPIWYPEGLKFYEKIRKLWVTLCDKQAIMPLCTPRDTTRESHFFVLEKELKEKKANCARSGEWVKVQRSLLPQECEGLFQTKEQTQEFVFRLFNEEEIERELIYSLQFMQELLSIFEIELSFALVLSRAKKAQAIQDVLAACSKQFDPVVEDAALRNAKPRLELRTKDARRKEWLIAFIEIETVETAQVLLTQSTVFSLERLLGIYLGGYKKA